MLIPNLSLNDSKVQAAKARFEEIPNLLCILGFEQLLFLFNEENNSIASIARLAEVTRQAMDNLYNTYFAKSFGKTGKERREYSRLKLRKAVSESKPREIALRRIWKAALSLGYKPERVCRPSRPTLFRSDVLIIDGALCKIHIAKTAKIMRQGALTPYSRVNVSCSSLINYEFDLVLQTVRSYPKRIFQIPAQKIRSLHQNKARVTLYIAAKKTQIPKKPGIDFWQYQWVRSANQKVA